MLRFLQGTQDCFPKESSSLNQTGLLILSTFLDLVIIYVVCLSHPFLNSPWGNLYNQWRGHVSHRRSMGQTAWYGPYDEVHMCREWTWRMDVCRLLPAPRCACLPVTTFERTKSTERQTFVWKLVLLQKQEKKYAMPLHESVMLDKVLMLGSQLRKAGRDITF